MTAERRLLLVTVASVYVLGLVELARLEEWWHGLVVGTVGLLVAVGLAELDRPAPDDPDRPRSRQERMRHMPWAKTARERERELA